MSERRTTVGPARPPPPAPRWIKVSIGIGFALILLFVVLHLTGLAPPMQHGMHQP